MRFPNDTGVVGDEYALDPERKGIHMRSPIHAGCVTPSDSPRRQRSPRRAALCVLLAVATLALPAGALADSISLSTPEAVQELPSKVSYTAESTERTYTVIAVNPPGVPCAPDPAEDAGQIITTSHMLEGGSTGQFAGSTDYTPAVVGTATACGWLEEPAGLLEMDGGAITASGSVPITVRAPQISLSLSLPRAPNSGQAFALDLNASSQVPRRVVVVGISDTDGCPINPAATSAQQLIDTEVDGGPSLIRADINPLAPGRWIFCAWADPLTDSGLLPQASTSLALTLPGAGSSTSAPHYTRPQGSRPATSTEFKAIRELLARGARSLHEQLDWVRVARGWPYALAYLSGADQVSVDLLKRADGRWKDLATISDEGLRCSLIPDAAVRALKLERFNAGPKPCERV
jgi:hypothetical protein